MELAVAPIKIEKFARSAASPSAVYAVAKRSRAYPEWSMIGAFELVRPGDGDEDGVGQLRIFKTGTVKLLEEIVELVPDRRVSYTLIKGLPFRDYRADIDITPIEGGGAQIHWHASFHPKIPGTGWLCRALMNSIFTRMTRQLARAAEQPNG